MMDENDYRDYENDERNGRAVGLYMLFAVLVTLFALFLLCSGCSTTKYVPIEKVRTEWKDNIREVHTLDSVIDTRLVYIKGDTVIDYRDRIKWRDRII